MRLDVVRLVDSRRLLQSVAQTLTPLKPKSITDKPKEGDKEK